MHHLIQTENDTGMPGLLTPYFPDALQLLRYRLVTEQQKIDITDAIHRKAIGHHMAIIEQIVGYRQLQQQEKEQDDSYRLGVFRTLHRADILRQCIICTPLPEEFGINLIVSIIQSPLMQGKRSHRTLISDVENNAVVGLHTVSKPFQFGSLREFWTAHHQILTLRILAQIMLVEIVDGRICKCQGTLVCTIDIAIISTIGKGISQSEFVGNLSGSLGMLMYLGCKRRHG